jgi:RNA polymerase sigma-70 factor (ECF subfamily)
MGQQMNFTKVELDFIPRLQRFVYKHGGGNATKDIVQEVCMAFLEKDKLEGDSQAWLLAVAKNMLRNRRRRKLPRHQEDQLQNENRIVDPHTDAEPDDRLASLKAAIERLDPLDQNILRLDMESVPQAEIADRFGISHGNVRVRLHRAIRRLRQKVTCCHSLAL